MSKPIRLLNVDQIVTSDGKVVDLSQIAEMPTINIADGYSAEVTSAFAFGGINETSSAYRSDYEEISFADLSTGVIQHTGLQTAKQSGRAESVGQTIYHICGYSSGGSVVGSIEKVALVTKSYSTISDTMTPTHTGMGFSNGSVIVHVGGNSTGTTYFSHMNSLNPSNDSVNNSYGTLTIGKRAAGAASSSDEAMLMGGMNDGSWAGVKDVSKFSLSSGGANVGFGQLTEDGKWSEGCSNNVSGFMAGVYKASYTTDIFTHSFSDNSAKVSFGTMVHVQYAGGESSNGEVGVRKGGHDTAATRNSDAFNMTDGSSYTIGSVLNHRYHCAGASGSSS